MKSQTYYVAAGAVRGACGHRHKSEDAATRCMIQDRMECWRKGLPLSDRRPVEVTPEELS